NFITDTFDDSYNHYYDENLFVEERSYKLGEYIGCENMVYEFKEFNVISPVKQMDTQENVQLRYDINEFVKTGKLTESIISLYEDSFVSLVSKSFNKYLSEFSNSSVNGRLVWGIGDDGIVTGIPLSYETLKKLVMNIIK